MRGEHESSRRDGHRAAGSSPRARGTPSCRPNSSRRRRFIPACAGNTKDARQRNKHFAVHPRVRGEHLPRDMKPVRPVGSSPRARGTRPAACAPGPQPRFIPACAGNTSGCRTRRRRPSVHPRVRGEHIDPLSCVKGVDGSSPRARGTHGHRRRHGLPGRFIPACAGNTASPGWSADPGSVHPRVRGEH